MCSLQPTMRGRSVVYNTGWIVVALSLWEGLEVVTGPCARVFIDFLALETAC
jgi:hypothetical protein